MFPKKNSIKDTSVCSVYTFLITLLLFIVQKSFTQTNANKYTNKYADTTLLQASSSINKKKSDGVYLIASGKGDSVLLRWVPSNITLWNLGNRYGYNIERLVVNHKEELSNQQKITIINKEPIYPFSEKKMDSLQKENKYVSVIKNIIYDDELLQQKVEEKNPLQILGKYKDLEMQLGLGLLSCDFSFQAALAAGLGFVDRTVLPTEKYIYRISIALPASMRKIQKYKQGVVMIQAKESFLKPKINTLTAIFGNKTISLNWDTKRVKGLYTAFNIEKSIDGIHFTRINKDPYISVATPEIQSSEEYAYYTDSLPHNFIKYYYRIKGITPFGEEGPVSNMVQGEGMDKIKHLPYFDTIIYKPVENNILLKWHITDSIKKVLEHIVIEKSNHPKGPFHSIANKKIHLHDTACIDIHPLSSNYYRIKLTQRNKMVTTTFPTLFLTEDSISPSTPAYCKAMVDSIGIVSIQWKANTEKDLRGYIIQKADKKNGPYFNVVAGVIKDTLVKDTLNLERFDTPFMYYKIFAVDKLYNVSNPTLPIPVRLPDTIVPIAPLLISLHQKDTLVKIFFLESNSKDVKQYTLYRHMPELKKIDTVPITKHSNDTLYYYDMPSVMGKRIYYEMIVEDSACNKNRTVTGSLLFETGYRKSIQNFKAEIDTSKKAIILTWQYTYPEIDRFIVYRCVNEKKDFLIYSTLDGNTFQYVDDQLNINNVYKYKIKAMLQHGVETLPSKVVEVLYPSRKR